MAAPPQHPPPAEEEQEEEDQQEVGGEGTPTPTQAAGDGECPPRRVVPGVLYLSHLPPGFGPRHVRALLAPHGELGRVFFQPLGGCPRQRRRRPLPPGGSFLEGWVEFRDKRAAKRAAALLHGAPMGTRPRSRLRHQHWSLKYLPGFRWPHLSERLGQERRAREQRLRAEVAQAKREAAFHARPAPSASGPAPSASGPAPSASGPAPSASGPTPRPWAFTQRATEAEIRRRKAPPPPNRKLLRKVFGGGA